MLARNLPQIFSQDQNQNQNLEPSNILYQDYFAAKMVELEISVEMNEFTVETLQKLMNFYSRAVDFFVQQQSSHYIYFKNKIKHLLLKPRVVELINAEEAKSNPRIPPKGELPKSSEANKPSTSKPQQQVKTLKPRPSLEYHMKMDNFQLNKELSTAHHTKHVEDLVKTYASARSIKEETIRSSLMDQKNSLRKRLEERKTNSRMSNQDKSALSMDKSRFEFSGRLTEFSGNPKSQNSIVSRQTVPLRSQTNLCSYDEYNLYQQYQLSPSDGRDNGPKESTPSQFNEYTPQKTS
jgi:hypothetical protein